MSAVYQFANRRRKTLIWRVNDRNTEGERRAEKGVAQDKAVRTGKVLRAEDGWPKTIPKGRACYKEEVQQKWSGSWQYKKEGQRL